MSNPLLLEEQLCFPFYAISREITKRYRPLLEPLGLTYPQYLVMLVLWEQDQQSLKAVGERLHLDSGTLTPLLKKLEASGLVERVKNPVDERHIQITLTANGQALRNEAEQIPLALKELLGVSDEDMELVKQTLNRLTIKMNGTD
ncbi:transcriptional regulator, MarR family [Exiguobacterium sibiricum 255-15]|uniref:Transcriptional regulator, MarR family n=1 Tax=Exiguobacterium sibiricum (strain DSM 17290 / CCUG 55495 / CIP 109462 / JCM 13490 / 255-15) TaxID=262543 RepID=B1YH20_EXIS2|nr:MarR family transcriptional regulator [Exiguobacterium sibiricum]ACB61081.1 transcriptional regulator, MarR family [Exiguobacterium sibiricum 255-15]